MQDPEVASAKRHKKWILAGVIVGIVLFSPCFVPDPGPPFHFLGRAELRYIQVHSEASGFRSYSSYMVEGDSPTVLRRAQEELKSWKHSKSSIADDLTNGPEILTVVEWNFGSSEAPMTHVLYERPARFTDHLRSPVHKVKSWLP